MNTNEYKIEPVFDFCSSESSVLLNQGQAEIHIDGNTYTGNCDVRLDLLPSSGLHLYGNFQGVPLPDALMLRTGQKMISSFSINSHQVKGFAVDIGGEATDQKVTIKWCPSFKAVVGVGDESTQMVRVVFHLFNFVELYGTRRSLETIDPESRLINHVDLSYGGWNIELKSLYATSDNFKDLKTKGGYRLTHVGRLEKVNRTPFSGKDANDSLKALHYFLSFAKGGWCEPVCAIGYDVSGNRTWECWSSPREPWQTPVSWFDPHNSSQIVSLFPGFMTRWANEDWCEALREVIYWYLNANQSSHGTDAGIILVQAAIERLSYEFAVKDRRLLTANGFKDLRASEKLRLLFSSLGIPLDIPVETPELQSLTIKSQMNWLDAPQALTEIRNYLVHPERKRRAQFGRVYYEAWNLSLWYLEMSILAICGYSGTYGNRLKQRWVGEVENVPWKK
jgi:hypothetical protein